MCQMSECDESTALRTCCMDLSHLFPFCSSFCIISELGNKTTQFFYTLWHFRVEISVLFCDTDLAHGSP